MFAGARSLFDNSIFVYSDELLLEINIAIMMRFTVMRWIEFILSSLYVIVLFSTCHKFILYHRILLHLLTKILSSNENLRFTYRAQVRKSAHHIRDRDDVLV